jgi:hypothetical protein
MGHLRLIHGAGPAVKPVGAFDSPTGWPVRYHRGEVDEDPIPRPVIERGTAKMRLASGTGSHRALEQAPEPVADDEAEDAPPVPSPRQGLITTAAAAARKVRDAEDTPADGVAAPQAARSMAGKKPKRRQPGWIAFVVGMLTVGPGWEELDDLIDEVRGKDEAVATAAELGELRGRLDEQSKTLAKAMEGAERKLAANSAGDLEASFNGALEYRHLDTNIAKLGRNIDRLLDAADIPEAERTVLAETPVEIEDRHTAEIRSYREAQRKADREALERSLAKP